MIISIDDNTAFDVWPIGIFILVVSLLILFYKKRNLSYLICFSLFWLYIMFGLKEALFPIEINGTYADVMRKIPITSQINLIPFNFGSIYTIDAVQRLLVSNILNIILTIPFGFGISFLAQIKSKNIIWLSIIVGFSIETTQLIISILLAYPYRVVDINDVLFNTVGVLIGYMFFRFFCWWYLVATKKLSMEHKGLFAYIYDVANKA